MSARVEVSDNLADIRRRMVDAAQAVGHDPEEVELVAVSKLQPEERIVAALEAGQRVFGENRIQEAAGRWPALRERYHGVVLHLIGGLQTNKVRQAVELFDVIETVDRPRLAKALAGEMDRTGRRPSCLVQVNTGAEPQKSGVLPADADAFVDACRRDYDLPVVGLMCIPPQDEEPSLHFALLREIAKRHDLGVLSMGMSADFEVAIRFGATHVRVGSALFGERPPKPA